MNHVDNRREATASDYSRPARLRSGGGVAERLRYHSGIYWEPVIAWRVVQSFNKDRDAWDEYIVPITADNHLDKDNPVLRYPDSRMTAIDGSDLADDDAVVAYCQKQLDDEQARRVAEKTKAK